MIISTNMPYAPTIHPALLQNAGYSSLENISHAIVCSILKGNEINPNKSIAEPD